MQNNTNNLIPSLCKAQLEFKPIQKSGKNFAFKKDGSPYATLDDILSAVVRPLAQNGLVLTSTVSEDRQFLIAVLVHESGDQLISRFPLAPKDNTMHGFAGARTYACRYAYSNLLALSCDEDDDGNASSLSDQKLREIDSLIGADAELKEWVIEGAKTLAGPQIKEIKHIPPQHMDYVISKLKQTKNQKAAI